MIPDFSEIELGAPVPADEAARQWRAAASESLSGADADLDAQIWDTPEGIAVQPLYTAEDLAEADFLDTYPGIAPYLRGIRLA